MPNRFDDTCRFDKIDMFILADFTQSTDFNLSTSPIDRQKSVDLEKSHKDSPGCLVPDPEVDPVPPDLADPLKPPLELGITWATEASSIVYNRYVTNLSIMIKRTYRFSYNR
jgi:hypothetical protein